MASVSCLFLAGINKWSFLMGQSVGAAPSRHPTADNPTNPPKSPQGSVSREKAEGETSLLCGKLETTTTVSQTARRWRYRLPNAVLLRRPHLFVPPRSKQEKDHARNRKCPYEHERGCNPSKEPRVCRLRGCLVTTRPRNCEVKFILHKHDAAQDLSVP